MESARLIWLYAPKHHRISHAFGKKQTEVPRSLIYTDYVQSEMNAAGGTEEVPEQGMTHGLSLLVPNHTTDITTIRPGPLRALADFYLTTKYANAPFVRFGILEAVSFEVPTRASGTVLRRVPPGLFFRHV